MPTVSHWEWCRNTVVLPVPYCSRLVLAGLECSNYDAKPMTLYSYVFRETEKGTFVPRISAHLLQCGYQARDPQNRGSVSPIWNIVHPAALLWPNRCRRGRSKQLKSYEDAGETRSIMPSATATISTTRPRLGVLVQ